MDLFIPTVNQMIFLFTLILIGFILVKTGVLDASAASVLSRLENNLFIPGLVAGTFITNFTAETLSSAWKLMLFSTVLELVLIPFFIFCGKKCTRDSYLQKICIYGLGFANFGFMGNAVVKALFPDIFTEYILFTLPLWVYIYLWGVPSLLIPDTSGKKSLVSRLKSFVNPMFVAMLIGMIIGLCKIPVPSPIMSVITVSGDCMSPIAMLLTGITIGGMDLKGTLRVPCIYIATGLRLLLIPMIILVLLRFLPVSETLAICAVCSVSMPLGLNSVVIPGAYGKDTSVAAGMALVSHLASLVTIPVVFILLRQFVL